MQCTPLLLSLVRVDPGHQCIASGPPRQPLIADRPVASRCSGHCSQPRRPRGSTWPPTATITPPHRSLLPSLHAAPPPHGRRAVHTALARLAVAGAGHGRHTRADTSPRMRPRRSSSSTPTLPEHSTVLINSTPPMTTAPNQHRRPD